MGHAGDHEETKPVVLIRARSHRARSPVPGKSERNLSLAHCTVGSIRIEARRAPETGPALGGGKVGLADESVNALAVFASYRFHFQAHLLAQRAADEPAHAVRLPIGRFHDLGESGTLVPG